MKFFSFCELFKRRKESFRLKSLNDCGLIICRKDSSCTEVIKWDHDCSELMQHRFHSGCVIYVEDLPSWTFTTDLLCVFKAFGTLSLDKIRVRKEMASSKCVALIEFKDRLSALNAVEASPLKVLDREVRVSLGTDMW